MAAVAELTRRRLRAELARVQVEGRLPSVVAGLVREGRLVWYDGYGDVPGDPLDTQYKIGSITKTMTAVLVLQLVAEGRLELSTRLAEVLGDHEYGDRTVGSVLAHDSGLPAEPAGPWWERTDGGSFVDLAAANAHRTGVFDAGERFHYSNLGYALLGEVVARLRGASWWQSLRSRVLEPLGMDRTSFHAAAPHASGWSVHPYANTLLAEPLPDTGSMAPAGQLWSTVADLGRWAGFLLDPHPGVLAAERLTVAFGPRTGSAESGLGYAHGFGFQLFPGGSGTLVGHSGSMPGFVAACFVDRPRGTGAVAMTNALSGMPATATAARLLDTLEDCEPTVPEPWRPVTRVLPELEDLLGVWHWGATPHVFQVVGEGERQRLVVSKQGTVVYRFAVVEDGRLVGTSGYQAGEELRVVRDPAGSINHLDLGSFVFTRVPYDPAAPIPGGPPA